LNKVMKDVIHDGLKHTYSLDPKKEKVIFDLVPISQVHKFHTWVGSQERSILISEINVLLV